MATVARAYGVLRSKYRIEGQTHLAERSGCAIGITALKIALTENRTPSSLRSRRATIGRTGFTTHRRGLNLAEGIGHRPVMFQG